MLVRHLAFLALRVVFGGVELEAGAAKARAMALHLAALPLLAKGLCHCQQILRQDMCRSARGSTSNLDIYYVLRCSTQFRHLVSCVHA